MTSLIKNSESVSHSSPSYMRLPFIVFPKRTFRGLFCCLRKLMTIFEKTIFGESKTCRKGRQQQTDQKQGLHDHTTFMNLNLLMKQKEKKPKTITIVLKHRWRWVSKPAWLLCCQFSFSSFFTDLPHNDSFGRDIPPIIIINYVSLQSNRLPTMTFSVLSIN